MAGKPAQSILFPIECSGKQNPYKMWFIRTGGIPPGTDQRLYDLCNFQIATSGMQSADSIIGELWVTYAVKFFKPQLSTLAENPLAVYSGYIDWTDQAGVQVMNSPTEEFNTIGCELAQGTGTNGGTLTFPAGSTGTYEIQIDAHTLDNATTSLVRNWIAPGIAELNNCSIQPGSLCPPAETFAEAPGGFIPQAISAGTNTFQVSSYNSSFIVALDDERVPASIVWGNGAGNPQNPWSSGSTGNEAVFTIKQIDGTFNWGSLDGTALKSKMVGEMKLPKEKEADGATPQIHKLTLGEEKWEMEDEYDHVKALQKHSMQAARDHAPHMSAQARAYSTRPKSKFGGLTTSAHANKKQKK